MNKIVQSDEIKSIEPWAISEDDFSEASSKVDSSGFSSGIMGVKQPDVSALGDIQQLLNEAQEKGFVRGKERGMAESDALYQEKINQLDSLLKSLSQPLDDMTESIEQTLTQLSLKIAGHLFRQELTVEPEKVEKIVHEALQLLPVTSQNIEIHLNHDDLLIIQDGSENSQGIEEKYHFVDDPALNRGDCKIISDTSEVDATLETRLESIWKTVFHNDDE